MIYVYWHTWCGQDASRFREITLRQYRLLSSSCLLDVGTVILCIRADHIGILPDEIKFSKKIKIFTVTDETFDEHMTYRVLHRDLEKGLIKNDDKIIYIHARGTSRSAEEHSTHCSDAWTKCMEYFLIEGWRKVDLVLDTHSTCGCELFNHPHGWHYSGNFWGARVDYLKAHTRAPNMSGIDDIGNRCCERWLLKSLTRGADNVSNHYCLHATGTGFVPSINTYEVIYDKSKYIASA